MQIILTLSFLWTINAWPNSDEPNKENLEFSLEEQQELEKYISREKSLEQKKRKSLYIHENKKSAYTPKPYRALIKENSVLTHVESQKQFKVSRDIYARVQNQFVGSPLSYVLNKNGEKKYTIATVDAQDIEQDLDLKSKIDPTKKYIHSLTRYNEKDRRLIFHNQFAFEYEAIDATYFANILQTEESAASSGRVNYNLYYQSSLPFLFGLEGSFQQGAFNYNSDSLSWNAFFLGPSISYQFREKEKWKYYVNTSVQRSYVFDAEDQTHSYQFVATQFQLGAMLEFDSNIGPFFLGMHYRNTRTSLANTNNKDIVQPTQRDPLISYGLMLGYRYNITL